MGCNKNTMEKLSHRRWILRVRSEGHAWTCTFAVWWAPPVRGVRGCKSSPACFPGARTAYYTQNFDSELCLLPRYHVLHLIVYASGTAPLGFWPVNDSRQKQFESSKGVSAVVAIAPQGFLDLPFLPVRTL